MSQELALLIERSADLKRTWSEHGEALLHRRKAWYYQREPIPASQ